MQDDLDPDNGDGLPHGEDDDGEDLKCPRAHGDKHAWQEVEKRRTKKKGERKFSAATISRDIRAMGLTSLHMMGGTQYLNWVARKHPAAYMAFLGKLVSRDDGADAGPVQFVVQKITIAPQPTPGVITSPIAGHVQPLRLVANGEVTDVEPGDAGPAQ